MKKNLIFVLSVLALAACDKHDPILPGVRDPIFDTNNMVMLNTDAPVVSGEFATSGDDACEYKLDSRNTIWADTRRIFTGFATDNSVAGQRHVYCQKRHIYAGLTTGELVKVNPTTRQIKWIADIYRPSNMTGGAAVLDIVAPIVFDKNYVYAGGLGKAFCKISDNTGKTSWCLDLGIEHRFLVNDSVIFVLDTDKNLYALRPTDGAAYWHTTVKKTADLEYIDGYIIVDRQKFDAKNGEIAN